MAMVRRVAHALRSANTARVFDDIAFFGNISMLPAGSLRHSGPLAPHLGRRSRLRVEQR
jgi:hypothetical protein